MRKQPLPMAVRKGKGKGKGRGIRSFLPILPILFAICAWLLVSEMDYQDRVQRGPDSKAQSNHQPLK